MPTLTSKSDIFGGQDSIKMMHSYKYNRFALPGPMTVLTKTQQLGRENSAP